jgi:hypothetical protein
LKGNSGIRRVHNNLLAVSKFHDCDVAVKVLPPFANEAAKNDFQKVGFLWVVVFFYYHVLFIYFKEK